MVSVGESFQVCHTCHHTADESAADSSCSVREISGLIVTEQATAFQAAQIQQERRERDAPDAFCDLPPVQQERPSLRVATIAKEGAGRGTSGAGGSANGDGSGFSVGADSRKVESKVGKFHRKERKERKGKKERKGSGRFTRKDRAQGHQVGKLPTMVDGKVANFSV